VQAQVDYSLINKNWYLPGRYYNTRIPLASGTNYLSLIVLDTSPCVSGYRSDNPENWDPCYPKYPTCSLTDSANDDFEGPCMFHENIISQNCKVQYNWFKTTLATIPENDWLLIVGHHPIDEVDVEDFIAPIQARGFSLYLNGHTHLLNQYTLNGLGIYFTTGAGSMVDTADQIQEMTAKKLIGESTKNANGYIYEVIDTYKVAGYLLHSFNDDFTQLTTQFVEFSGSILNTVVSDRLGNIITSNSST
jgi:hypothetical protein